MTGEEGSLWRDPLDELIEDLEQVLPATASSADLDQQRLLDTQRMVSLVLDGTEEEQERAKTEPWYRRYEQWLAEQIARKQEQDAASKADAPQE